MAVPAPEESRRDMPCLENKAVSKAETQHSEEGWQDEAGDVSPVEEARPTVSSDWEALKLRCPRTSQGEDGTSGRGSEGSRMWERSTRTEFWLEQRVGGISIYVLRSLSANITTAFSIVLFPKCFYIKTYL